MTALSPCLERGKLIIGPKDDVNLALVAVADAAECAVAAVDADDVCGRVVTIASPEHLRVSEMATTTARAAGRDVKVVAGWPRWALAALRAIGRRPFTLPAELRTDLPSDDLSSLHPGPWRTMKEIAKTIYSPGPDSRRNDDHATLGMH